MERTGRVIFRIRSELSRSSGCVESDVEVEGPLSAPESVGMLVDAGAVCCLRWGGRGCAGVGEVGGLVEE